ncbi:MAG: sigma-70 family RNA polymerase sigma factor [Parasphingorhabdus sp.]|uniref:sigma-70 family RNA polymerase sigma factor n=1 Tax=Parasphingorhabdus sp. TaxID=2709688 RepID=UPI003298539F
MDRAKAIDRRNDDALMRAIGARDSNALREIAEAYGHIPFGISCRMLADPMEAEDIAQEALLRLWNQADRWVEGGPGIAAWLSRVGTNLCIDRIRKTRRQSSEEVPEHRDETPLADAALESDNVKQAIIDCVTGLPERQRASIILTYYEQLSNQLAAENLEMNIKAFESMLFRARGKLKKCVETKGLVKEDVGRICP